MDVANASAARAEAGRRAVRIVRAERRASRGGAVVRRQPSAPVANRDRVLHELYDRNVRLNLDKDFALEAAREVHTLAHSPARLLPLHPAVLISKRLPQLTCAPHREWRQLTPGAVPGGSVWGAAPSFETPELQAEDEAASEVLPRPAGHGVGAETGAEPSAGGVLADSAAGEALEDPSVGCAVGLFCRILRVLRNLQVTSRQAGGAAAGAVSV